MSGGNVRQGERQIGNRSLQLVRGVFKKLTQLKDRTKLQHVDLEVFGEETHEGVEHFEGYGRTSRPKEDAEVLVAYLGANRAHPVVVSVIDRRYRPTDLEEGESTMYDDQGQRVHLKRDRILITSSKKIELKVGNCSVFITANRIDLGKENAPFQVETTGGPSNVVWSVVNL